MVDISKGWLQRSVYFNEKSRKALELIMENTGKTISQSVQLAVITFANDLIAAGKNFPDEGTTSFGKEENNENTSVRMRNWFLPGEKLNKEEE